MIHRPPLPNSGLSSLSVPVQYKTFQERRRQGSAETAETLSTDQAACESVAAIWSLIARRRLRSSVSRSCDVG